MADVTDEKYFPLKQQDIERSSMSGSEQETLLDGNEAYVRQRKKSKFARYGNRAASILNALLLGGNVVLLIALLRNHPHYANSMANLARPQIVAPCRSSNGLQNSILTKSQHRPSM